MTTSEYQSKLEAVLKPLKQEGEDDFYTKNIAPNTVDYLRYLAGHASSVQFVGFYDDDREEQLDRIFGGAEGEVWKQDNTYNYNEAWSDVMCVAMTKDIDTKGDYKIAFAPHYGGDVRGNYGDFVVLTFPSFYDYYDFTSEFLSESAYVFELDGKKYECYYTGSGEHFFLRQLDGDFESDGFYPEPWTEEEFLASVRETIE